ncbi:GIY-YIG nuclease family protein [Cytophagaceae bacterium ABcell3]|nr:GIY-YIG nuclease family protein [Cytophagaceae bacterium ABcell3]
MLAIMYHTYVLYSPQYQKIYIGSTSNLKEIVNSHNEHATKGWTIRYRPWILFYKEAFQTKQEALEREKQLKTAQGRQFIWDMINGSYTA